VKGSILLLVRTALVGLHPRPFLPIRPFLPALGDLWVPFPRVPQLVRQILVGQRGLQAQLNLLLHLLQTLQLGQHLHLFLPLRRLLLVLGDLLLLLARVDLLVRPLPLGQWALELQRVLVFRLFRAPLIGQ